MKTVDKYCEKTQATYHCVVPDGMFSRKLYLAEAEFPALSAWQAIQVPFDLTRFVSRYLAGSICLREARKVSRKRLALLRAGVPKHDQLGMQLLEQCWHYEQHLTAFESFDYRPESLEKLHGLIDQKHHNAGAFRRTQNWVGGKSASDATFVCPPPEMVNDLMDDWLEFIKTQPLDDLNALVSAYFQFIMIHPFSDGNGRMSRIFFDATMRKYLGGGHQYISPFLYRMAHNKRGYMVDRAAIEDDDWQRVTDFWQTALQWSLDTSLHFQQLITHANHALNQALLFQQISPAAKALLGYLWQQPIVTYSHVAAALNISEREALQAIQTLQQAGIIKRYQLRDPKGWVIYDCPQVLSVWDAMERYLYQV